MATTTGKAFFFDLQSGNMTDMPQRDAVPQLPEALALKLNDLNRTTTRAEIDANITKASQNREKILREKVEKAKQHDVKIEKAKQLKRDMDENMTLLGNTIPSELRSLPTSPTLPKRLKKRLETLEQQSPPKTADMIRERESRALANRNRILEEKREKARSSFPAREPVPQESTPPTPPPYDAVKLPQRLVDRLASLPPKKTTKQILDRYSTASRNREGMLRTRQQAVRDHLNRVETLRMFSANKQKIKLPASLAKRLERIAFKHSAEAIFAKEKNVQERRTAMLQARVFQSREHWASVQRVASKAAARKQQISQKVQEIQSVPETASKQLPKALSNRLENYMAKKKTPKDVLDYLSQVTVNHMSLLNQRVARAREHSEKVEYRRMVRMNKKKPKMTKHLEALLATRPQRKSPQEILARLERATQQREEFLKTRSMNGKKVVEHAFQVAHAAKLAKAKLAADAHLEVERKAAKFLPQHLKAKLAQFQKPTEFQIRDRLDLCDVRREKLLRERSKRCAKHSELVEERKMCRNNRKVAKLTKKLGKRLEDLEAKKPNATQLLDRERKAIERRSLQIVQVEQKVKDHLSHVAAVGAKAASTRQEMNSPVRTLRIIPELPAELVKRVETLHIPSKQEILEKEDAAFVARKKHYEAVARKAREHSEKVELMRMMKGNKKVPKLTKHLKARLAERMEMHPRQTKEQLLAKEQKAIESRLSRLEAKRQAAMEHNKIPADRLAAKRAGKYDTAQQQQE